MKFARIILPGLVGLSLFVGGCNSAPQSQLERANAHLRRGETSEAIAIGTELIQKNDKDIAALLLRASAYNDQGEFQNAVNDLDRVLALDGANERALMLRSYSHRGLGQEDKALADDAQLRKGQSYKEAYASNPESLTPLPKARKVESELLDPEEKKLAHRAALEEAVDPRKALAKKRAESSDPAKEDTDVDPLADDKPLLSDDLPADAFAPGELSGPNRPVKSATLKTPGSADIEETYQRLTRPKDAGASGGYKGLIEDWKSGDDPTKDPRRKPTDSPLFDTETDRLLKQLTAPRRGVREEAVENPADRGSFEGSSPKGLGSEGAASEGVAGSRDRSGAPSGLGTGSDYSIPRTPLSPTGRPERGRVERAADGYKPETYKPETTPRIEPLKPAISSALPLSPTGQIDPSGSMRSSLPAGMRPTGASPGISSALPISPSFGLGQGSSMTGYGGLGISPNGMRPGQGFSGMGIGVSTGLNPGGYGSGNFNGMGPAAPRSTGLQPGISSALPGSGTGMQPGSAALPNYVVPFQPNPSRGTGTRPLR